MARAPFMSISIFIFMLLSLCSSVFAGTELGFSIDARESNSASSLNKTLSLLELNEVSVSQIRVSLADVRVLSKLSDSGLSVDLYLDENLVKNLTASKSSAVLWLKTHVVTVLPYANIKSVTLKGTNDLSRLLSSLKLIHSAVSSFQVDEQVKVSVAFSLELLENLNRISPKNLQSVLGFMKKINSFVIVEVGFDDYGVKHGKLDSFLESKLTSDANIVLTVKCNNEVVKLGDKLLKSLENGRFSGRIVEFYVELERVREHEHKFPSFRRELMKNSETFSHESLTIPPDNPTPNIVTVPATNPVTITPTIPASTPLPIPSTAPVMVPPSSPFVNPPAPITNPVTTPVGGQPVPNPVGPPATTNGPIVSGQSWCVAKTGATQSVVQAGLDYACGMGGADCSQIQQGGGCYNPNTLQNHASFAFNSYYQKNPVATSCDFGGAASLVSTNPSTGSCVFPSSSSSSTSTSPPSMPTLPPPTTPTTNPATMPSPTNPGTTPSPTNPAPTPVTTNPPTTPTTNPATTPITTNPATTPSPTNPTTPPITTNPATTPATTNPNTTPATPVGGDSGFVTPPSVLNSSSPGSEFGSESPPGIGLTSSASKTGAFQPVISCIITVTFLFAKTTILDM